MKKLFLTAFILVSTFLGSVSLYSQSASLVVTAENGQRFALKINGIIQSQVLTSDLKITNVPDSVCKVRVQFEKNLSPPISKTIQLRHGTQTTYAIHKNKKGETQLRFMSQVVYEQVPHDPASRNVVGFRAAPNETSAEHDFIAQPEQPLIITTGQEPPDHSAVSISTTTTVTTTTTQVTTQTMPSGGSVKGKPIYEMPGYSGQVGCPYPMTDLDFQDVKRTIESKSFENSKLTIAKEVVGANCLFASEVKQIMKLFDFENSRLEFAKYAYRFTFDQGNYYKLNDAFEFEHSIQELNEFVQKQK